MRDQILEKIAMTTSPLQSAINCVRSGHYAPDDIILVCEAAEALERLEGCAEHIKARAFNMIEIGIFSDGGFIVGKRGDTSACASDKTLPLAIAEFEKKLSK